MWTLQASRIVPLHHVITQASVVVFIGLLQYWDTAARLRVEHLVCHMFDWEYAQINLIPLR